MVEALRVVHAVVILAVVLVYTYYMFIGFHSQSFKYAKNSYEEIINKNIYMKRDIEKWKEEQRQEEMIQKQAEELENEAKRLRELAKVDKIAQMELELKFLREQLANNADGVQFVNENVEKKSRHGGKLDKSLDMKEQARRIKDQMSKLNLVPQGKTHASIDGIREVSNKDGVLVPEDLLENMQFYSDEAQMEDLIEDYIPKVELPSVEDIIEEYIKTDGNFLTDEELLAEFDYVEEEPENDQNDYYETDDGGFCDMGTSTQTCGFG